MQRNFDADFAIVSNRTKAVRIRALHPSCGDQVGGKVRMVILSDTLKRARMNLLFHDVVFSIRQQ